MSDVQTELEAIHGQLISIAFEQIHAKPADQVAALQGLATLKVAEMLEQLDEGLRAGDFNIHTWLDGSG